MRAKLKSKTVTHNLPLEISLYLVRYQALPVRSGPHMHMYLHRPYRITPQSSYIAALQTRKAIDAPTSSKSVSSIGADSDSRPYDSHLLAALLNSLNQLVDALTGLERILTTPIPFSYVVQLLSFFRFAPLTAIHQISCASLDRDPPVLLLAGE